MCLVHSAVPGLSNESIVDDLALAVFSVLWHHAEQHQHSDAVQGTVWLQVQMQPRPRHGFHINMQMIWLMLKNLSECYTG